MGLYADDIVCYWRNPLASVKALKQLLVEFSLDCGYKINMDKSIFSGFSITKQMKEAVSKIIPGKWQNDGVKYLGIKICRSKEAMVKENIIPFVEYMREKCQLWSMHHLSWIGRIAAIKIVL